MIRIKPFVLGIPLALLASLALAVPTQAEDLKGVCLVDGTAKFIDKDDPSFGIKLVGGSAKFTFEDTVAICAGLSKGEPYQPLLLPVQGTGVYENTVCGTGKAVGQVFAPTDDKFGAAFHLAQFAIELVAGEGLFYWRDPSPNSDFLKQPTIPKTQPTPDGKGVEPEPGAWMYAGNVHVFPPAPIEKPPGVGPPDNCTKAVHFTAELKMWNFDE